MAYFVSPVAPILTAVLSILSRVPAQGPLEIGGPCQTPGKIEFLLRLYGLWEGVIDIPPPPKPPFDIKTFEPIEPPWQAIKEWIPDDVPDLTWFNQPRKPKEPRYFRAVRE